MVSERAALLPMHEFLSQLQKWQTDRSADQLDHLRTSLNRIADAYGALGVLLEIDVPPLAALEVGTGTLRDPDASRPEVTAHEIALPSDARGTARMVVDGQYAAINRLLDAIELSLSAVWSLESSARQRQQLEALDLAVRGIAGVLTVEEVLQLIVDRVRDLVGSRYAALGIVGPFGQIEQFIVSGISDELRAQLGPPPRGHGLLGLIIREDRSLLIDDIAKDPHRYGFPPHHPDMHSLLGVPVRSKGSSIGNLYLTDKLNAATFNEADLRLVERFALHAGIAIENARLHEEIGRLAIVDERQRISQDLHDSIIQSLYAISLSLEDLPDVIAEDPVEGAARADRAIDSIHATIRDIRNFIMGLQPELLSDANLVDGIRTLGAEFEANTLIDLEVDISRDVSEPPEDVSAHLLAIIREALSNIARHSSATRASVKVTASGDTIRLVITDNGRGFDVTETRASSHRGLTNLTARTNAIGATMNLDSASGRGTRLELEIPTHREGMNVQ
ncbi:MAG TPA: GAF domain-containing sensor histidine kinase [Candidatus Limnocylindrales bacterium]